jgi:hypothetical protein
MAEALRKEGEKMEAEERMKKLLEGKIFNLKN